MNKFYLGLVFWLLSLVLPCQSVAQGALNLTLLSNFDDPALPDYNGVVYNDIWGYVDPSGREYAIIGAVEGFFVVDVSIPTSPVIVSYELDNGTSKIWRDFKTYDQYLYAVSDGGTGGSLQVYDLTDLPNSVTKVFDDNSTFSKCHNIFIDEGSGRLYAVGTNTSYGGIFIFDIASDPTSPSLLADVNLGVYTHDIYCFDDTCYAYTGFSGMRVLDFKDIASSSTIANFDGYPEEGYCHSGWATSDQNYMVMADETHDTGLKVLDISDLSNINWVSTFRSTLEGPTYTNSVAHNPFIRGNLVYISYYHDGVQVYDISDKANPTLSAYYDTETNADYTGYAGSWGVYPFLPSGIILGSDIQNGLFVLDGVPLKVELSVFQARPTDGQVQLTWSTLSEVNFDRFEVERSTDGVFFSQVGVVKSKGKSSAGSRYQLTDASPASGASWYRLAQWDLNGNVEYSEVERVFLEEQLENWSVFPNPVDDHAQIQIDFALPYAGKVEISLSDLRGRISILETYQLEFGTHSKEMDMVGLKSGIYFLELTGPDLHFSQKVIIK